jgi:poly(A) polymerase
MTEREFAIDVVHRLRQSGFEAFWAGGCVRDELLGLVPADYDVATSARPEQVIGTFRRTIEVGVSFGVVEVIGPRRSDGTIPKVQVATFRCDGVYSDGRRPDSVTFATAEQDAQRRDFTINGMFFDPIEGRIIDYVGGQHDLASKTLRAIGDAHERFREDKLRMLRAVRMAARFDFPIEATTANAIREMASQITIVSPERIAEEIRKFLVHDNRSRAVGQLAELGLLMPTLPEFANVASGDGWPTTLEVLKILQGPTLPEPSSVSFPLAFAAMMHLAGSRLAVTAGRRLRFSNDELGRIEWLIDHAPKLADVSTMKASQRNPILCHAGIGELLALNRCIARNSPNKLADVEFCERILRTVPRTELDPPPLLTGDDLVALGWKPGPQFKRILDATRIAQLDGEIFLRADALKFADSLRLP